MEAQSLTIPLNATHGTVYIYFKCNLFSSSFALLRHLLFFPCERYASSKKPDELLKPWTLAPRRRDALSWARTRRARSFPKSREN